MMRNVDKTLLKQAPALKRGGRMDDMKDFVFYAIKRCITRSKMLFPMMAADAMRFFSKKEMTGICPASTYSPPAA